MYISSISIGSEIHYFPGSAAPNHICVLCVVATEFSILSMNYVSSSYAIYWNVNLSLLISVSIHMCCSGHVRFWFPWFTTTTTSS